MASFIHQTTRMLASPLLLACCAVPVLVNACPREEFAGQLQGSHKEEVSVTNSKLLAIEQTGRDIKLLIDAPGSQWMNYPGGRNSVDYIFLKSAKTASSVEVCFYTLYDKGAQGQYRVRSVDIDNSRAALIPLLENFNQIGAANYRETQADLELAVAKYEELQRANVGAALNIPALDFNLRLFEGLTQYSVRKYDTALALFEGLQQQRYSANPLYYQAFWQAGRAHRQQLREENVEALVLRAKQLLADSSVIQGTAAVLDQGDMSDLLMEVYTDANDFVAAREHLAIALAAGKLDYMLMGKVLNFASHLNDVEAASRGARGAELNRYTEQALDLLLQASYFAKTSQDHLGYQSTENNLAISYMRIGEIKKAFVHFGNVLSAFEKVKTPEGEAFFYSNISNYSMAVGDYEKAKAFLQYSISRSVGVESVRVAGYYCRLGNAQRYLGELAQAEQSHQRCLQMANKVASLDTAVEANLQLSIDALQVGNLAVAATQIGAVLKQEASIKDKNQVRRIWTQQAAVLHAQGQEEAALTAINMAFASGGDQRFPNDMVNMQLVAMQIAMGMSDSTTAMRHGSEAMAFIESIHAQLEAERLGPAWSNLSDKVFTTVAQLFLDQAIANDSQAALAEAFLIIERSRDISLRQRLTSPISNEALSLEEAKQIELFSSIAGLLAGTGEDAETFRPTIVDYHHQHDLLSLARLNNLATELAVPAVLGLSEVQQRLQPNQLALDYLLTDDDLYTIAITRDKAAVERHALTDEINNALQSSSGLLNKNNALQLEQLQRLTAVLLPDLAETPSATELIISGHRSLYTFPFAALPLPESTDSYLPLISRLTVTSVPSLSVSLAQKPTIERNHAIEVTVLADPLFDQLQLTTLDLPQTEPSFLRQWTDSLVPLPFTAKEAQSIEETIISGKVVAYTGASANRAHLTSEETRNSRILHIASHGYFQSTSVDNVGWHLQQWMKMATAILASSR